MSHKSGHVIINLALPHDTEEEENNHLRKEPCVVFDLKDGCTEDDCAELARLAYRKLTKRE